MYHSHKPHNTLLFYVKLIAGLYLLFIAIGSSFIAWDFSKEKDNLRYIVKTATQKSYLRDMSDLLKEMENYSKNTFPPEESMKKLMEFKQSMTHLLTNVTFIMDEDSLYYFEQEWERYYTHYSHYVQNKHLSEESEKNPAILALHAEVLFDLLHSFQEECNKSESHYFLKAFFNKLSLYYGGLIILLIFLIVFSYVLFKKHIFRPLQKIEQALVGFQHHHYDNKNMELERNSEIGHIALHIFALQDRLKKEACVLTEELSVEDVGTALSQVTEPQAVHMMLALKAKTQQIVLYAEENFSFLHDIIDKMQSITELLTPMEEQGEPNRVIALQPTPNLTTEERATLTSNIEEMKEFMQQIQLISSNASLLLPHFKLEEDHPFAIVALSLRHISGKMKHHFMRLFEHLPALLSQNSSNSTNESKIFEEKNKMTKLVEEFNQLKMCITQAYNSGKIINSESKALFLTLEEKESLEDHP